MFKSIVINTSTKSLLISLLSITSLLSTPTTLRAQEPPRESAQEKQKADIKHGDIKNAPIKKLTNKQKKLLKDKINSQGLNPQPSPPGEKLLKKKTPLLKTTKPSNTRLLNKKQSSNMNNNLKNNGLQSIKGSAAVEFILKGMSNAKPNKEFAKLCEKINVFAKVANDKLKRLSPKHKPRLVVSSSGWKNSSRGVGNVCKTEFSAFHVNQEVHFIASLTDSKYKVSKLVQKKSFSHEKGQSVIFRIVKK